MVDGQAFRFANMLMINSVLFETAFAALHICYWKTIDYNCYTHKYDNQWKLKLLFFTETFGALPYIYSFKSIYFTIYCDFIHEIRLFKTFISSFGNDFHCCFRISHLWVIRIRSNIEYNSLDRNFKFIQIDHWLRLYKWIVLFFFSGRNVFARVFVYLYLRVCCIFYICLLRKFYDSDGANSMENAKAWMAYANNRIHVHIIKKIISTASIALQ